MIELTLTPSANERAAGRLGPESRRLAALLLRTAGCVVLRDALDLAQVDAFEAAFARVFADCVASRQGDSWYQVSQREQAVFWERGQRWRIFPKLRPPFGDALLLANPLVVGVLEELLGDGFHCKFVSSDTCLRGSALQAPHREFSAGGARAPCAYIVNVPLTACRRDNGAIEVWPGGSHLWPPEMLALYQVSDDVQDGANAEMEAIARRLPSRRLELERGSILIRDPGMLHRGTPNATGAPRTMLTICYQRHDHAHDYGDIRFNLDDEIYSRLAPEVQRVLAGALAARAAGPPAR